MANTRLTRTAGTPTLNTKFTISVWVKRASLGADQFIMDGVQDSSNRFKFAFQSANKLEIWNSHSGSDTFAINTNRVFRDTSAWMHIVLSVDTTDGTAGDRVKLYINGVRETSFSSSTNPSQNDANNVINESGAGVHIGDYNGGNNAFSGCMSHFHFCDGTALAPTVFGETDSTTGEWKIKTSPSFTLGNNGFTILKDGNTITDQSANSNNFTLGAGTLTKTEDNPSNVFATLNPLVNYSNFSGGTLSNGNTTHSNSSGTSNKISTLGMTSGKFYAEAKYTGGGNYNGVGFCSEPFLSGAASLANSTHGASLTYTDVYNGGVAYGTYATPSTNDIIGIALDIDNGYAYFSNNGVWGNSGVPTSGSTGTGGFLISKTDANSTYFFASEQNATPGTRGADWNFGNGFFGTTAISSEGTNASGIGKFEYDVPTGFTALSTKGLNE